MRALAPLPITGGGLRHADRLQQPCSERCRPGATVDRLDQLAEHPEAPVAVMKLAARRERLRGTPIGPRAEHRRILGHAARMGQQVMHKDVAEFALHGEPRQVFTNRSLQIDLHPPRASAESQTPQRTW